MSHLGFVLWSFGCISQSQPCSQQHWCPHRTSVPPSPVCLFHVRRILQSPFLPLSCAPPAQPAQISEQNSPCFFQALPEVVSRPGHLPGLAHSLPVPSHPCAVPSLRSLSPLQGGDDRTWQRRLWAGSGCCFYHLGFSFPSAGSSEAKHP